MNVTEKANAPGFFDRHPVFRFVFLFGTFLFVFYAVWFVNTYKETGVFDGYLKVTAKVSALILQTFGENARAVGHSLSSPRVSLEILAGCDALAPMALYAAGIFALAAPMRTKLIGLPLGLGLIIALNQVRIISLYYIRIHRPSIFEMMHVDVWQSVFIVFSVVLWTAWALWATRPNPSSNPAAKNAKTVNDAVA